MQWDRVPGAWLAYIKRLFTFRLIISIQLHALHFKSSFKVVLVIFLTTLKLITPKDKVKKLHNSYS